MSDSKKKKEYFFLLFLKRSYTEEANENVEFTNSEDKSNIPKCILTKEIEANENVEFTNSEDKSNIPKCILTKEINGYIIKVFKLSKELKGDYKAHFEFFYDGKQYKLNLDKLRDKTFLFDVDIVQSNNIKLEQTKMDISEKMNYLMKPWMYKKSMKKEYLI